MIFPSGANKFRMIYSRTICKNSFILFHLYIFRFVNLEKEYYFWILQKLLDELEIIK